VKHALVIGIIGMIAALFQGTLLYIGIPSYLLPQVVLILVIYLGFHEVSLVGVFTVFGLGLLMDFASAVLVGPWAGAYVAVYGALAVASQRLFVESAIVMVVTGFVACVCADLIYLGLAYEYQPSGSSYIVDSIGQAFATAIVAPVFMAILARVLYRRTVPVLGRVSAATMA
jgi:rod shape-determining protein MreD